MPDLLEKFIAQAKESIASGYYNAPAQVDVKKISLKQALLKNDFSLIAELKRASPTGDYSLGNIGVEKTAKTFQECGAAAVSVVVAQKSFSGQVIDVTLVKKTIELPVLFKDFIIDFKQIDCAKSVGADAVLLIQSVMNKCGLNVNEFIEYAHKNNLEVFLECYDEKEFSTALQTKADVMGVNNRDLQTLKVDLNRTKKIIGAVDEKLLAGRPLISESGIKTREDSLYVKNLGASGVLVGTALWKTGNQAQKIGELALKPKKYYGEFGGSFVSELLVPVLEELDAEFEKARKDPSFNSELQKLLKTYAGRPTPLYYAANLSKKFGARIYLKREDLLHTGAHKINNTLGQVLLAKKMGKTRVIAETGAGQHGVATATAAALLGLECVVYMGSEDARRQALNVYRMKLLGARVEVIDAGSRTLKDAINEALRDYATNFASTHYCLGSALGPYPFPKIVGYFQSVIGEEARKQVMDAEKKLPDYLLACVGGGSNAIGLFSAFLNDESVKKIGVEAGGKGISSGKHAARLSGDGKIGVLHGCKTSVLQDGFGQIRETHSVSAGLDYPAVGPQHTYLQSLKQAEYVNVTDEEALSGFHLLAECEGIIPALESAHAIAYLPKLVKKIPKDSVIIINLSGRGDKDVQSVLELEGGL